LGINPPIMEQAIMIKFFQYKGIEVWGLKEQYEIKCSFMHEGMHYFNVRKDTWKEVTDFIDQHSNH